MFPFIMHLAKYFIQSS